MKRRAARAPSLIETVDALARVYRARDPAPKDAFGLIVWENAGYLIDDARRSALFGEFAARVGLSADAIAGARASVLLDLARRGGMRPEDRVAKWRRIAELTATRAGGDLNATLEALPKAKAAALLKAYPGIGVPGADKIMLLAGLDVRPALDSNGLRTMLRLGFCAEGKSYPVSYRAAMEVLRAHGTATRAWFATAYRVLKAHGRALCKHGAPLCDGCPLSARCPKVSVKEP